MGRKRTLPEDWNLARATKLYGELGEQLYGLGEGKRETRKDRRQIKLDRRVLETYFPTLRSVESDTYRDAAAARELPVPRMAIEYAVPGYSGKVVYPNGSRKLYATRAFTRPSELLDVIAELILEKKVDPDRTQVVVGGSAHPLLTLLPTLG
jgi:hypothetical protein